MSMGVYSRRPANGLMRCNEQESGPREYCHMKSQSWLAPLRALAASVRAAFSSDTRSRRNTKRKTKDLRRGQRHAVGRGAELRRNAPAPAPFTAKPSPEPSVAFGLFRTVAIVLFICGAAGAVDAAPTAGSLPDSSTSASLTQSLKGFFTRLWSPDISDAEKPTIAKNRFANLDTNANPGTTNSPALEFNLRYPNHYDDKESGLFENRNRFYSPLTGRYTQGDGFGLDAGPNRFTYALGDPFGLFDDNGLEPKKPNGAAPAPY